MTIPALNNTKSRVFSLINAREVPNRDLYFIMDITRKDHTHEVYQHEPSKIVYIKRINLDEHNPKPDVWYRIDYE